MTNIKNLKMKITNVANSAIKKSNDLVEVTKINLKINSLESEIEELYKKIGMDVFQKYMNGIDELQLKYEQECDLIKTKYDEIMKLKQKAALLKGFKFCQKCNSEIEAEYVYCPKCGSMQNE
ncbi:hypothetical protein Calkr_2322 [Caldicellulosiruptor acetigenus I77R1B]|jgi:hypothetical protein|uniref:Zinc-ribbon domain-containing protein n=2 Tax=Caldicellulosiruptor acetigenus TaxID=301953 RepID=G2PVS0_9FIRM|nr:zinc ribbon domain-containing protein [Caldicellulosiruptor acetigenus]ADQ41772.1 hypothetical protein Calkr_2322 [Caldicellulosiruptor acetigenus I77R1B]AEM72814.1 hypothetical protein Calla_0126 [Caldicellulosiruptor acetigenus 6A]